MRIISNSFEEELAVLRIENGKALPFWKEFKAIFDEDHCDNLYSYFMFLYYKFKLYRLDRKYYRSFEDFLKCNPYNKIIPKDD